MPNITTLLDQHVVLKYEMADRIFGHAYLPRLQDPEDLAWFLTKHRGEEIPRYELLGEITRCYVAGVEKFAAAPNIPMVTFERGQDKEDLVKPYFDRFRAQGGCEGVVLIALGQAVVKAAREQGLAVADPQQFEALPGLGVRANADGHTMRLGRARLLADQGLHVPGAVDRHATTLAGPGRTVIAVARGEETVGLLVLEDALRPESAGAVKQLSEMGIRTVLISGDSRSTAERIARELGIDEVHAELLPQEKVDLVRKLQAGGRKVMFVGDGVNDGPALAVADVGVAMGRGGTDVAIETAEIGLLSDDLSKLPHLLQVSRQAIRAIKQNLVFSLGVLAVAVGLTLPGILTPVTGALLHELSSIPVIGNSARLIRLPKKV